MKAIMLTYDRNSILANHVIEKYAQLWPDHPFEFIVPYQTKKFDSTRRVTFVQTPVSIIATLLHLLEPIPDEEWVFWCIDDWYPIALDLQRIREIYQHIDTGKLDHLSGIKIATCYKKGRLERNRQLKNASAVSRLGSLKVVDVKNYDEIWLHQFVRAGVLKYLFSNIPNPQNGAKDMDYSKEKLQRPKEQKLVLTQTDLASFGESASQGMIRMNCLESMRKLNLHPDEQRLSKGLAPFLKARGRINIFRQLRMMLINR